MTYPIHVLLNWGGRLGTTGEEWSNSLRLTANVLDPVALQAACRDQIEGIDEAISLGITSGELFYGNSAYHDYTKMNTIRADGRYWDQGNTVAIYHDGSPGIHSPYDMGAFQLALVVSFETGRARGPGHAGRLYVPAMSVSAISDDNGQVTAPALDIYATHWANLCNNINDNPGLDVMGIRCAVVSKVGNPGPAEDITGVKIGRVLDTQRRRRASLTENYTPTVAVTGQG